MFKLIYLALSVWVICALPVNTGSSLKAALNDTVIIKTDSLIAKPDSSMVADSLFNADSVVPTGKVIRGIASFYSGKLDGTKTSTGEIYRNNKLSGASNNVKLNTWVRVTNLSNGKTVVVRINDRMHPNMKKRGRVIDLSRIAAKKLDFMSKGLTKVKMEVIEKPGKP